MSAAGPEADVEVPFNADVLTTGEFTFTSPANTSQLPVNRRTPIEAVRAVLRGNLPPGYKEGMQHKMAG